MNVRWPHALVAVGVIALITGTTAFNVPAAAHARCKVVRTTVHGKAKRVRVCKKSPLPQAGSVAATISLGAGVQITKVAASDTAVWVLSTDRRLFRIDPTTNSVTATLDLPNSEWPESDVAYGEGSVWVTVASPDTVNHPELDSVLRIDAQTNQLLARIHVGHSPEGIAFTPGTVWVANHRNEFGGASSGEFDISRVDAASNTETGRVLVETRALSNGCCGPQGMTAAAGSVWMTDPQESGNGVVLRLDPTTNTVTLIPFVKVDAQACGDMAGDEGSLWVVPGCNGRLLIRIDPRTNQIVSQVQLAAIVQEVAIGFGSVWATANVPFGNTGSSGLDRIDPATNKLLARTHIPTPRTLPSGATAPLGLAVGAGSIWVGGGNTLFRLTPR
jgi:DNA-binding beta-propeller fold protein YncE